jgi:type I restriction enzyme M protein
MVDSIQYESETFKYSNLFPSVPSFVILALHLYQLKDCTVATNFNDIAERIWNATDRLRANTPLRAFEYSVPVLGLIFLKFADQKFTTVDRVLQEREQQSDGHLMLSSAHYKAEGAIYLDEQARYGYLSKLSTGVGMALNNAMKLIERDNPESLAGTLPINGYSTLDNNTLKAFLAAFDGIPSKIEDDLFSKIYEYFLGKFALAEGQRGGEFFTPTSIVKLIVEIIEPFHGLIFDPACGAGGMLVESAQFAGRHRLGPNEDISIYGQEKTSETVRLCKMNLTVHGISGDVQWANSYYEDPYSSTNKFDFVIANPPFNVNGVDKQRLLNKQQCFPFGIPRADNANYLWIQLFYSALKDTGQAGFVMPNSASDARSSEQEIRRRLIQQRVVDVMIAVGSNFFYTVTLPCTLWFFDKGKRQTSRRDKVLFIDARHLYKQIDRSHREFTPEQLEFLANIVRLYRGETVETVISSATKLQETFTTGKYIDVPGLCKVATLAEIEAQNWSLNPGRYVGEAGKNVTVHAIKRTNVFISYCHKDLNYLERLRIHLAFQEREAGIDFWDDTRITPGEVWREEIKKALSCTKVAILLISADFLASKFIAEDELPPLLMAATKEEAVILPVILSPCAFRDSQLADFQAVNDPSRPLIGMNKFNKEKVWDEVAKKVRNVMNSKS